MSTRPVYLTGLGKYLPGKPVTNDEMEDYLGRIRGRPSRARARVLRQNGILGRHYALDTSQRTTHRNSELAANAVRDALRQARAELLDVDFLAAATTQGDLCVPGFASMVHGELGGRRMELASLHGVCASGVMALKDAYLRVATGDAQVAVACASELPSRLFKASRYERQLGPDEDLPFDTEFLRWMLSDGAGAAVLRSAPAAEGLSLRVEWIDLHSHAHQNEACMVAGANKGRDGQLGPSWLDYPSFEAAAREGVLNLKQDVRQLDRVVKQGVAGFFELIERGRIDPAALDWVVCHYSSHVFRGRIFELLEAGGLRLPEERWFTNLYTKGNVGSASLYLMLEELLNDTGRLRPGQQVFCMVPESGRFISAYLLLTVVGPDAPVPAPAARPVELSPAPHLAVDAHDPVQATLVRQLTGVWVDFEARLRQVPVVRRLETGGLTLEDYKLLLVNLRQQVVEGARWIARAASSLDAEQLPLRSLFLAHARDEHRDFQLLERDYVAVGGALEDIQRAPKNVGSEALSAWMFHRAGQPDPLDLLGAMFIIEGLGAQLALGWAERIQAQLGLRADQVSFLRHHGQADDAHLGKLERVVRSGLLTPALVARAVKTARVTARLYLLQLEELGNA